MDSAKDNTVAPPEGNADDLCDMGCGIVHSLTCDIQISGGRCGRPYHHRGFHRLPPTPESVSLTERTDTERLDWMENNPGVINPENAVSPSWNMEGFHDEEEGWGSEELGLWCPTLRKAIDKAMESPDVR